MQDPMIGRVLGPYEILERVGAGGMGTVYRAVHVGLGQARAIKLLPPSLAADRVLVERFMREARTAASLHHPNVVRIYDVGETEGTYYLVMELVAGRSLREHRIAERGLSNARVIGLLRQLAEALDAAHAVGIIHRDVKPANAIVGPNDRLTLVDFGIARMVEGTRLTGAGLIGTPEYMAPELLRGRPPGPSVDQYALGIVAYELLTGRLPFSGATTPAIMFSHVHEAPPPPRQLRPDLPPAAEAVLLRQLAKDPEERYPTAQAFVAALSAAMTSETIPDLPPLPGRSDDPEFGEAATPTPFVRPGRLGPDAEQPRRPGGATLVPPAPLGVASSAGRSPGTGRRVRLGAAAGGLVLLAVLVAAALRFGAAPSTVPATATVPVANPTPSSPPVAAAPAATLPPPTLVPTATPAPTIAPPPCRPSPRAPRRSRPRPPRSAARCRSRSPMRTASPSCGGSGAAR